MSCLFCKNFAAVEPEAHRKERETRTCAHNCGRDWDAYTAARYVKEHKTYLGGLCHLNPALVAVRCESMCSHFEDGFYPAWHIGQPGERQNIHDWAHQKMRDHIFGDYQEKEHKLLTEDNKKLRAALKASRERSAARLVRLKKAMKPKALPKPMLRLVAAE